MIYKTNTSNIAFYNPNNFAEGIEVWLDSKLTHHKDESGVHFKLATPKYKYTIERTTFDLKNLFNGNKQLGEKINHLR